LALRQASPAAEEQGQPRSKRRCPNPHRIHAPLPSLEATGSPPSYWSAHAAARWTFPFISHMRNAAGCDKKI
jgi:hypothetical protein